jgi:hypothetical protein
MLQLLRDLRKECVIAFVGGSDLRKISEQLTEHGENGPLTKLVDHCTTLN